jgi:hypothetical protein
MGNSPGDESRLENVMPAYHWPNDPMQVIAQFEARHGNSESTALLMFAAWAVDSLYYLSDVDRSLDPSQATIGDHVADVVDVAHARWATGTCITALDLCAAALARGFCAQTGMRELDIGNFDPERATTKRVARRRADLPAQTRLWIDNVLKDPDYNQIKAARDSLTHKRVRRHLTCPRQRLRLQVEDNQLDVPTIIDRAKDVASKHVSRLLAILPELNSQF